MCEVSAVWKRQAHNGISGFDECQICGPICYRAGIRLDVCVVGFEQFLCSFLRHSFNQVCYLLAFVVPFAGITFRVFVCKAASTGFHYGS
ncbi:hypothetical protein ES703_56277 [subsurface metagenome]